MINIISTSVPHRLSGLAPAFCLPRVCKRDPPFLKLPLLYCELLLCVSICDCICIWFWYFSNAPVHISSDCWGCKHLQIVVWSHVTWCILDWMNDRLCLYLSVFVFVFDGQLFVWAGAVYPRLSEWWALPARSTAISSASTRQNPGTRGNCHQNSKARAHQQSTKTGASTRKYTMWKLSPPLTPKLHSSKSTWTEH